MVAPRRIMVLQFSRRDLRAQLAASSRKGVRLLKSLTVAVPRDLAEADAKQLGEWIGDQLRAAGFPRKRAVVAMARDQLVMKRLTLPSTDPAELPDMTRLALRRDLSLDPDTAVIDCIAQERTSASTAVLAVAIPKQALDFVQEVMSAAGVSIARITPRCFGVAALQLDDASASLVIDVEEGGFEFSVVHQRMVRTSRAAAISDSTDALAKVETLVTETRRTWMSFEGSGEAAGVASVTLLGNQRICEYAANPIGQLLQRPARPLGEHPQVIIDPTHLHHDWALCGLMLEDALGHETINLANPRRAPDLGARRRQRWLAAAGFALIALLAVGTMARQQLRQLEAKANELAGLQRSKQSESTRYWRDRYRLEHLRQWESAKVDWLQHTAYLAHLAPPRQRMVLDSWSGMLESTGVKYDKTTGALRADPQVTILIEGEARDRETADLFRAALVQSTVYATATLGADAKGGKRMPHGFTYRLRTKEGAPADSSGESGLQLAGSAEAEATPAEARP